LEWSASDGASNLPRSGFCHTLCRVAKAFPRRTSYPLNLGVIKQETTFMAQATQQGINRQASQGMDQYGTKSHNTMKNHIITHEASMVHNAHHTYVSTNPYDVPPCHKGSAYVQTGIHVSRRRAVYVHGFPPFFQMSRAHIRQKGCGDPISHFYGPLDKV
jgi:hypothetical protein